MTQKNFVSLSEEIRYYMKDLLSDKKLHSTAEVKEYVRNTTNNNEISEGAFSGAIRDLLAKEPQYTNPKRGYYQLNDTDSLLLLTVEKVLTDAKEEIDNELKKIDGSKITEDIFNDVVRTQNVVNELKNLLTKFKNND